jgi:hypothetical protein
MEYGEVPKYRKKLDSNVSKSSHRSTHKHIYAKCYLKTTIARTLYIDAKYCTICGRISDPSYFWHSYPEPENKSLKIFPYPDNADCVDLNNELQY